MTIYDFATEVTVIGPTAGGAAVHYSDTYDLAGGSDGVAQLFGGDQLYMQFEVSTAFTVDNGAPMVQFGVAIDNAATLTATSHVLAMTGGSIATYVGMDAAQLTLGRTFHLAIPSWEDIMEITGTVWPDTSGADGAELTAFRLFRYMGIIAYTPLIATANFATGAVKARITTQGTVGTAVTSNIYPSRMRVL